MTCQDLNYFYTFAKEALEAGSVESLAELVQRWTKIQETKAGISEISSMGEAAAGCGYSRDEILAQYEDQLEMLQRVPQQNS